MMFPAGRSPRDVCIGRGDRIREHLNARDALLWLVDVLSDPLRECENRNAQSLAHKALMLKQPTSFIAAGYTPDGSGFEDLPFELRDRIYRLVFDVPFSVQTPGTPVTAAYTLLDRKFKCLTPRTPGKCPVGCPVHDDGLQVLRLNSRIAQQVKSLFNEDSWCEILINEHGIFRNYRVSPVWKHTYNQNLRMPPVKGAFGIDDGRKTQKCDDDCPCRQHRGLRVSVQLTPLQELDAACWRDENWSPPCKMHCPIEIRRQGIYAGQAHRPYQERKGPCPCVRHSVSHNVLGPLMFNKSFFTLRDNVFRFVNERYPGMTVHHEINLAIRLEFIHCFENGAKIQGDAVSMARSVLDPFRDVARQDPDRLRVEVWPRKTAVQKITRGFHATKQVQRWKNDDVYMRWVDRHIRSRYGIDDEYIAFRNKCVLGQVDELAVQPVIKHMLNAKDRNGDYGEAFDRCILSFRRNRKHIDRAIKYAALDTVRQHQTSKRLNEASIGELEGYDWKFRSWIKEVEKWAQLSPNARRRQPFPSFWKFRSLLDSPRILSELAEFRRGR